MSTLPPGPRLPRALQAVDLGAESGDPAEAIRGFRLGY